MIFLAVDLAIFERLTGAPLDSKGKPKVDANNVPVNRSFIGPPARGRLTTTLLPSYGIVIPEPKVPNDFKNMLTTSDPDAAKLFASGFDKRGTRQVPIFDENLEARKWADVWPCVTFRWRSHDFDAQSYIYADPFATFDQQSPPRTVDGVTKTRDRIIRPEPMGWTLEYVITAYSKARMELGMICEQIQRLFPPRGGLQVKQADGSIITIDMVLQRVETLDQTNSEGVLKSLGMAEDEYLARAYVFKVEAYDDTTFIQGQTPNGAFVGDQFGFHDVYATPVVTQRILELKDLQAASYQNAFILDP